ncbi:hypothetical protein D1B31_13875 [Neobacillus notoginsengisoli]|uniref:Uncharacterized protein n=1 Tax=Neobacillus notoginsengisoli TaxID=1578198 RepID=A0A417YSQ8_9BACI|nr:hypothetical protein D1B31_13875 [Neobacillus notoginsengisoli]
MGLHKKGFFQLLPNGLVSRDKLSSTNPRLPAKPKGASPMQWKKYFLLLPPFLLLTFILLRILPDGQKHNAIYAAFAFWAVYYALVCYEKRKKAKQNE